MTTTDLDVLREIDSAASPGDWHWAGNTLTCFQVAEVNF